jgi:glyoxylase-like metal-dependent hydrolase (beta-lactamase superfamily II)
MLNMGNFFAPRFQGRLARTEAAYAKEIATGKDEEGNTLSAKELADETTFMTRYRTFVAETQTVRRTYPTLTYVDELRLGRGNHEIVLMSVTGDAKGTTVMYLPQSKILVTGDAVSYPLPYTTPPPTEHAASLRKLARLDVGAIVPGHGPVFRDKEYLNLEAEFLEAAVARVRASLRKPLFLLADVQKDVSMDDFRARFTKGDATLNRQFAGFASGVVRLAYLESRDNQEARP